MEVGIRRQEDSLSQLFQSGVGVDAETVGGAQKAG